MIDAPRWGGERPAAGRGAWCWPLLAVLAASTPAPVRAEGDAPAPGGDAVERFDFEELAPAPGAAEPSVPPAPAAAPVELQVSGWVREHVDAGLSRAGFHKDAPNSLDVPYDQITLRSQAFLRLRALQRGRFEAVLSGLLGHSLHVQDAPQRDPFYVFNASSSRSYFEAALREAYVGLFWRTVDLRVGQQRLVWGRSDAFAPNDVLNARDLRDPLLGETQAIDLPTPMVRLDAELGRAGTVQLVVAPFFVPDQVDVYGRNWSRIQPDAPPVFRAIFFQAHQFIDYTQWPQFQALLGQTSVPFDNLSNTAAGARWSNAIGKLDVDLYYHYGFDRVPTLELAPGLIEAAQQVDFAAFGFQDLLRLFASFSPTVPIAGHYERRHHLGSSAQTTLGPFVVRLDAAYDSQLHYNRYDNLATVALPTVQLVGGLEYQTGDLGKTLILEAWYQHLFDLPPATPLLGALTDSLAVGGVMRWTFFERLELELRGVVAQRPWSVTLRPQVAWKKDAWSVRAGVLVLEGGRGSLAHYYRRNQAGYLTARYSF